MGIQRHLRVETTGAAAEVDGQGLEMRWRDTSKVPSVQEGCSYRSPRWINISSRTPNSRVEQQGGDSYCLRECWYVHCQGHFQVGGQTRFIYWAAGAKIGRRDAVINISTSESNAQPLSPMSQFLRALFASSHLSSTTFNRWAYWSCLVCSVVNPVHRS